MVATGQRFHELHPEVRVEWSVQSLQAFAAEPLSRLADSFDLLVIDHPSTAAAAEGGLLSPLETLLDRDFLDDQAAHSVGASHRSYCHNGSQWALAIDAAAPISGWRPDLMAKSGVGVPQTWEQVLNLAGRGLVAVPGLAIDSLMHFFMLCGAVGEEPFQARHCLVEQESGVKALRLLRDLLQLCDPTCLDRNPIRIWELLAAGDTVAYCPFAYGYSNYSRPGYAAHPLDVGPIPVFDRRTKFRSVLGGAGLAVSRRSRQQEIAAEYLRFVASAECQATIYFDSGGQPGHRSAWLSQTTNQRANGFFLKTLPTLDNTLLRPRFNGYLSFQDAASLLVHDYLVRGGSEPDLVVKIDRLFVAAHDDPEGEV